MTPARYAELKTWMTSKRFLQPQQLALAFVECMMEIDRLQKALDFIRKNEVRKEEQNGGEE